MSRWELRSETGSSVDQLKSKENQFTICSHSDVHLPPSIRATMIVSCGRRHRFDPTLSNNKTNKINKYRKWRVIWSKKFLFIECFVICFFFFSNTSWQHCIFGNEHIQNQSDTGNECKSQSFRKFICEYVRQIDNISIDSVSKCQWKFTTITTTTSTSRSAVTPFFHVCKKIQKKKKSNQIIENNCFEWDNEMEQFKMWCNSMSSRHILRRMCFMPSACAESVETVVNDYKRLYGRLLFYVCRTIFFLYEFFTF